MNEGREEKENLKYKLGYIFCTSHTGLSWTATDSLFDYVPDFRCFCLYY